jgi:hypothetical protein
MRVGDAEESNSDGVHESSIMLGVSSHGESPH